jgi:hypothetical protein
MASVCSSSRMARLSSGATTIAMERVCRSGLTEPVDLSPGKYARRCCALREREPGVGENDGRAVPEGVSALDRIRQAPQVGRPALAKPLVGRAARQDWVACACGALRMPLMRRNANHAERTSSPSPIVPVLPQRRTPGSPPSSPAASRVQ